MNFLKHLKERLRVIVALTTFVALITVATVYSTALSDEVEIRCDGEVIVIDRSPKSVFRALVDEGIFIDSYDTVLPGLDVRVEDVDYIIVHRGTKVTLTDAGVVDDCKTNAGTVAEFFEEKGRPIGEFDEVTPSADTPVTEGMEISIVRVEKIIEEDVVSLPFTTEKRKNSEMLEGQSKVAQSGKKGSKTIYTEVTYRNGEEISREVVDEAVTEEPVTKIIEVGTKVVSPKGSRDGNTITAPDGKTYTYSKVLTCNATAYDGSYESNGKWGAVSATGKALRVGMVAVDPTVIPLGTKLFIEAPDGTWVYGYAVAEDTGSAIKGNKIDLFFRTRSEALQFGRRTAKVYILK